MKLHFVFALSAFLIVAIMTRKGLTQNLNATALNVNINGRLDMLELARKFLMNIFPGDNTFVGRCFGIAKKIRQLLPIFIFKMGAIVTILGFLTLFSMKTIGLLLLLLIINVGGAVAKVTAFLTGKHQENVQKKPQNIHLHFHQTKHGYQLENHGYDWEDRNDVESYNLYDKLSKNSYLMTHKRQFVR